MHLRRLFQHALRTIALGFLLAPLSPALAGEKVVTNTKLFLTRPADAPDADAQGSLRLFTHTKQQRDRFDLKVLNVDTDSLHELWIETSPLSGDYAWAAYLTEKAGKNLFLKLDTMKGDALPLGASTNADYQGCRVQVRLGLDTVLECLVPSDAGGNGDDGDSRRGDRGGDDPGDGGDDTDGDADEDSLANIKLKVRLQPPGDDAPAPKMKGKLRLRAFKKKGVQRLRIGAKGIPYEDRTFHVFLEEPRDSGNYVDVGELEQRRKSMKGRYRRNTRKGEGLPLGADFLSTLTDRGVQIRDQDDVVYLMGTIPPMK
jgi:hypothetical protein